MDNCAYREINWVKLPSSGGTEPDRLFMPRLLFNHSAYKKEEDRNTSNIKKTAAN